MSSATFILTGARNHSRTGGAVSPWVMMLALAACGDRVGPPTSPEGSVASVTISPAAITIPFGTKTQLTATVKSATGNELTDRTVEWTSSNTDIATVTSRGLVVAVAPGSATITASAEGIDGTASITVPPLVFAALSAGGVHTCGFTTDGAVYCWGYDVTNDGITDPSIPKPVSSGLTFQSLSAGGLHTCGVTTDGAAHCWGPNHYGQLGNGSATETGTPEAVAGGLKFQSVTGGGWHSCGVTTEDAAYCWGWGDGGRLGNGSTTDKNTPEAVHGGLTFQSLSAGRWHTCGISTDDAVYCWGLDGESTPQEVTGEQIFQSLSVGENHSCGFSTDGAGYCWGLGFSGQLGNGSTSDASMPETVAGGLIFQSLSAGGDHSCGVTTDGIAYCWGFNDGGQLGNGSTDRVAHTTPEAVTGGLTFQSVSTGLFHSCGLTTNGAAYCWGWNAVGQLGSNGANNKLMTPVLVTGQQ